VTAPPATWGVATAEAAAALDPAELGGKAANLVRLAAAGAAVPAWVVIPASAHAQAADRAGAVAGPVGDAAGALPGEPGDPGAAALPDEPGEPGEPGDPGVPDALLDAVARALDEAGLGDALLAVRSSAVGEDAAGSSFAGQFETVLGVAARDREALRSAIGRVWASASAERVLAYLGPASRGTAPRMAVILQTLVDAEAAGVAFSADPVTGDRATAVVSAVRGLGEALVAGEEDGDSYRVRFRGDAAEVVEARFAPQSRALRREGGGTRWVDLDDATGDVPAISEAEAVEVARAARRLAVSLGAPQDIEWALVAPGDAAEPGVAAGPAPDPVGGAGPVPRRLVLLQARPITTLAAGERRIWDNSNIVESYAGVTTPLTFSFALGVYEDVYRQFCQVMGVEDRLIDRNRQVFAHMLGLVRGRVYYNLLNWYRLLSLLPGYAFNRAFMERMMGVREKLSDPPEPQLVAGKWSDLWRLVRMVARMVTASRGLRRDVPAFHRRLDATLLPLADADLSTWPSDDLLALYRRLEDELLRNWQTPLVNDFFAMIWFGVLGRLVERWLPTEPPTLVNDLLAGEGGMISTEPARRVMALAGQVAASPALEGLLRRHEDDGALLAALEAAAGDAAAAGSEANADVVAFHGTLRDYLRRFGDRCANELKLETVTLSDDPAFLLATVRSYWRQGATDPESGRARETAIRAAAEARLEERLGGVRRRVFRGVLGQARARIRDRENLRFERTRVFGVVRRIFLGLGQAMTRAGRLDGPRDVFWLAVPEVFGWADGTAVTLDLRRLVAARREEFAGYEGGPAPPERFETWGPPAEVDLERLAAAARASGAGGPGGAVGQGVAGGTDGAGGPGEAGTLVGIGCCPGLVRATVRLVRDPRQAGDLAGRILVAERTDPGWTLLFPSAAGILVQRGSLLSHSAIVAREMGIPCVVSVPGLMEALVDGEEVEMDGSAGTIRRLAAVGGEPGGEPGGAAEGAPPEVRTPRARSGPR
jgi:rifampicin phosphotransferase